MQRTYFGELTWPQCCRELLHDGAEQAGSARCPQLRREEYTNGLKGSAEERPGVKEAPEDCEWGSDG